MSTARTVSATATGGALAVSVLFACATNVEIGQQDRPEPGAPPPGGLHEAGTGDADVDADVTADAAPDAGSDGTVPGACSKGDFCYMSPPIQSPLSGVSG